MSCLLNAISENFASEGNQQTAPFLESGKRPDGGAPDPRAPDPHMRKTTSACCACEGTFCGRLPAAEWPLPPGGFSAARQRGGACGTRWSCCRSWSAGWSRSADTAASAAIYGFSSGKRPEPCSWPLGLDLRWLVSWKGAWAGSPWRIRSFSQGQPLPASPGPKSLSRGLPETGPKPALETESWRGGESVWAAPLLCFLESSEHCQTLTAWPWESFFFSSFAGLHLPSMYCKELSEVSTVKYLSFQISWSFLLTPLPHGLGIVDKSSLVIWRYCIYLFSVL